MNRRAPPKGTHDSCEARRQVEAYCHSLVAAGLARWRINDTGERELQLETGQVYLFGERGVSRL